MFLLSILYFVPAIILILRTLDIPEVNDASGLYYLIKFLNKTFDIGGMIYYEPNVAAAALLAGNEYASDRKNMLTIIAAVFGCGIAFEFFWLIILRRRILKKAADLDASSDTPSDYCLLIQNIKNGLYDPASLTEAIEDELLKKFKIAKEDIVYVNPSYDISDFSKTMK